MAESFPERALYQADDLGRDSRPPFDLIRGSIPLSAIDSDDISSSGDQDGGWDWPLLACVWGRSGACANSLLAGHETLAELSLSVTDPVRALRFDKPPLLRTTCVPLPPPLHSPTRHFPICVRVMRHTNIPPHARPLGQHTIDACCVVLPPGAPVRGGGPAPPPTHPRGAVVGGPDDSASSMGLPCAPAIQTPAHAVAFPCAAQVLLVREQELQARERQVQQRETEVRRYAELTDHDIQKEREAYYKKIRLGAVTEADRRRMKGPSRLPPPPPPSRCRGFPDETRGFWWRKGGWWSIDNGWPALGGGSASSALALRTGRTGALRLLA